MNIETILSEPLRRAVQSAYERRDYTAAIFDAVYFLGDVIRERSGLDCDGVALIGQAERVNKNETPSVKV